MLPSSKYCAPSPYSPVVESMTPSVGITQGGDIAVVRGRLGSDPNGEVLIGGKACEILTRSSMTTWVCVTPPGIGPAGDVLVSNYGASPSLLPLRVGRSRVSLSTARQKFCGRPPNFFPYLCKPHQVEAFRVVVWSSLSVEKILRQRAT